MKKSEIDSVFLESLYKDIDYNYGRTVMLQCEKYIQDMSDNDNFYPPAIINSVIRKCVDPYLFVTANLNQ